VTITNKNGLYISKLLRDQVLKVLATKRCQVHEVQDTELDVILSHVIHKSKCHIIPQL
jgi:hypothetical protein